MRSVGRTPSHISPHAGGTPPHISGSRRWNGSHADELIWRFCYADGEMTGLGSSWKEEYVPVYHPETVDMRRAAAARRAKEIDEVLRQLGGPLEAVLMRVYGAPNRHPVFGPAGNLVELVGHRWHQASHSRRVYEKWIRREMGKAQRGTGDKRLVREMSAAAEGLLERAEEAYAALR